MDPDLWLQPLATVLGAVVVGTAAYLTLRQRRSADEALLQVERAVLAHQRAVDRRQQWWVRAQWAIDKSLASDPLSKQVGAGAMIVLADEDSDPADLALLLLAAEEVVDTGRPEAHTGVPIGEAPGPGGGAHEGPREF